VCVTAGGLSKILRPGYFKLGFVKFVMEFGKVNVCSVLFECMRFRVDRG